MNSMFKGKGKNIVAIAFTAFYTVMLILRIDFRSPFFHDLRYTINSLFTYLIPLITPVLVLIFLFSLNREYRLKKWLFPIAFGVTFITNFISVCSSFIDMKGNHLAPIYSIIFLCSCLALVAIAFMFVGTLFDFKYIHLLKYGALGCAVLTFATLVIDFITAGGFAYLFVYLQKVSLGVVVPTLLAWIRALACILFYIGIFILTTSKKNTNPV